MTMHKIGHGQPMVISYTRYVELESPMLHVNLQIIYSQFRGRSFVKVFTIYGDGGHLGHVTLTNLNKLSTPLPSDALYEV